MRETAQLLVERGVECAFAPHLAATRILAAHSGCPTIPPNESLTSLNIRACQHSRHRRCWQLAVRAEIDIKRVRRARGVGCVPRGGAKGSRLRGTILS